MEQRVKLGGVWDAESKNGTPYKSGRFKRSLLIDVLGQMDSDEVRLAMWPNGYKRETKQPDWVMYVSPCAPRDATKDDATHEQNDRPKPTIDTDLPF